MRKVTARKIHKFAIIAVALLAAATAQAADTVYRSPLHNFSVPIPSGNEVQSQNREHGGVVTFFNTAGKLKSILYLRLSPETAAQQQDRKQHWEILKSFLNDYAMTNLIRRNSPAASVLHAEPVHGKDYRAYFALVDIPEGSTMFDPKDGRRYDTKRGLLIFIKGEFIYMLSSGEHPSALEVGRPAPPLQQLIKVEKTALSRFRATISFR